MLTLSLALEVTETKRRRIIKVLAGVNTMIMVDLHVRVSELVGNSEQRTRNRLREKGKKGFLVKQISNSCKAWSPPRRAILLMSVDDMESGRDPWLGWLPMDEIDIVAWKE